MVGEKRSHKNVGYIDLLRKGKLYLMKELDQPSQVVLESIFCYSWSLFLISMLPHGPVGTVLIVLRKYLALTIKKNKS